MSPRVEAAARAVTLRDRREAAIFATWSILTVAATLFLLWE